VFVTLDDARGPIDATFFEDAQGPYAATLFHSWLLVIRGHVRRTGPRGVSMRATGCWELPELHAAWLAGGLDAVAAVMAASGPVTDRSVAGAAESRSTRPVMTRPPLGGSAEVYEPREVGKAGSAGGMGRPRRVLVHASGFRQSPYADIKTPGESGDDARAAARKEAAKAPRKLWHSSPGSSGG
jgi:error-prone DNA polymerase